MTPAVTAFEASLQLRLVTRGMIAILCVAAVFFFLFYPDHSGFVTFPIPLLVVAFALLRTFGKAAHLLIANSDRSARARRVHWVTALAASASDFLLKAFVAFVLAVTAVIASTYDFPQLGIAAALTLLVATLVNHPVCGLFPDASLNERRDRARRQTREALALAALETQLAPGVASCAHEEQRTETEASRVQDTPLQEAATKEVYIELDDTHEEDVFMADSSEVDFYTDAPEPLHLIADRAG